jgi:nitrate/nitrite transporter NarK
LYFWSKDATKRGVKTWHIALPALIGGLSIPLALFAGSPAATIAVITVTAMAIFAALPNFWTVPTQFLTGAAAAAGIALINTLGNLAGFSAGFVTGWLKDWTGSYVVPMFVVGALMLLSALLMVILSRRGKVSEGVRAEALDPAGAGHHAEP